MNVGPPDCVTDVGITRLAKGCASLAAKKPPQNPQNVANFARLMGFALSVDAIHLIVEAGVTRAANPAPPEDVPAIKNFGHSEILVAFAPNAVKIRVQEENGATRAENKCE
jgi:hypothetical protein